MPKPRKYTEAQKQSAKKWDAANLDRMSVAAPKGEKAAIQAAAAAAGLSANAYILESVRCRMESDGGNAETLSEAVENQPVEIPGYPISREVMYMLFRVSEAEAGRVMKAANAYFLRGEMPEPPFEGIAKEAFDRIREDTDRYAAEYRNGTA